MTEDEVKLVLEYCWKLSRLVSPRDAETLGLNNFDGSVCTFLNDLSSQGPATFEVVKDEFYSEVFNKMKEDLGDAQDRTIISQ